jgi:hypothetical protein
MFSSMNSITLTLNLFPKVLQLSSQLGPLDVDPHNSLGDPYRAPDGNAGTRRQER